MKNNELTSRVVTGVLGALVFFGTYFSSKSLFCVLLICVLAYTLVLEWPCLVSPRSWWFYLTAPLYPGLPIASLFALNIMYRDIDLLVPLCPFIIAWAHDTCAYFVGKAYGKHKLTPVISPKKTWEGLGGGYLGVASALYFLPPSYSGITLLIVAVFYTLLACSGDIFISYLKRRKKIKDSGNLLPGHGGILDRFDSVFFVAPIFFLLKFLF
jgi:phosphatidate cytidylyltransferase